jgi:tetratricopeptide (TPR) repeat protein
MQTEWKVGDRIQNRWEVHKIHRGWMGIVYVVYDHELREPFAAKTLQDQVFATNPETAERFEREALAWIKVGLHDNITKAHCVVKIQDKPYLILEYVSGGDLSRWIRHQNLRNHLPQVIRLAAQFCDGMFHALSSGIVVHRDIKPQNCLVTEDNILKVTDFGLAKVFDEVQGNESQPASSLGGSVFHLSMGGKGAGTCTHMAPEQFADAKQVDVRADIYSFGVMLFQMVKGKLPFEGRTWEEFARLHREAVPPPLQSGQLLLDAIVERCLNKDPGKRFSNFSEIRAQLAELWETLTGEQMAPPIAAIGMFDTTSQNRGVGLLVHGQSEEALACFDKPFQIYPDYPKALANKSTLLLKLGWTAEALECANRALELEPTSASFYAIKGKALAAFGRNEEALSCIELAIQLDPADNSAPSLLVKVLLDLARSLRITSPQKALANYDRALGVDPTHWLALSERGIVLAMCGRNQEALASLDRALALNPERPELWYNKGLFLADYMTQFDDAILCFEKAKQFGLQKKEAVSAIKACRAKELRKGWMDFSFEDLLGS